MQQRTFVAIILSVFLLAAAAAVSDTGQGLSDTRAARTISVTDGSSSGSTGENGFFITYKDSSSYGHYTTLLRDSGKLDDVAAELNAYTRPTAAVPIVFKECGESGAYYDVRVDEITFCYEFVNDFNEAFTRERNTKQQRNDAVVDAVAFILAHEAGHAVMDIHRVPFTGREEDVADQFATLVLTRMGDGQAAVHGGEAFRLLGEQDGQFNLWSEHALDEQRYYNMLCWTRGADDEYDRITDDLPEKRRKSCAREFNNIESSWTALLE